MTHNETPNVADSHTGQAAVAIAILLTVAITIHLSLTPVIDWSLPLYLGALLIGWSGEVWLCGGAIGRRLHGIMTAVYRRRWELTALAVLSMGGLALRLWMATRYGLLHGTDNDELAVAYQAWQLAHGTSPWPLYVVENGGAALYQPYSLAFLLFGAGMHTLRVTIAVENALLVPAFYFLARSNGHLGADCHERLQPLLAWACWPATLGMMAFGMVLNQCLSIAWSCAAPRWYSAWEFLRQSQPGAAYLRCVATAIWGAASCRLPPCRFSCFFSFADPVRCSGESR